MKVNWRALVILLLPACVLPAYASEIDAPMRSADRRLETTISISERRICLGDLLDLVSKKTHIAIRMRDTEPASGLRLTVNCVEAPVADVLNALSTIDGMRDDEWKWTREGEPGSFVYKLLPPHQSARRAEQLQSAVESALENYVDLMISMAYSSPDERRRNKRKLSEALNQTDDRLADNLIEQTRMWDYVRLFAEVTPADLRYKVVRGEQDVRVSVKSLPGETQSLFQKIWDRFDPRTNGVQDPKPDTLHFYSKANVGVVPAVVPAVWLDLGEGNGSVTVLGGYVLEDGVRAQIKKLWMLTGDTEDNALDQRPIPSTVAGVASTLQPLDSGLSRPQSHELLQQGLDTRLIQLAKGASISIITLLPFSQGSDPGDPTGTVRVFLSTLRNQSLSPICKWRGSVLLVTYPKWFMDDNDDLAVPYRIIHSYLSAGDGFVSMSAAVGLFSSVTRHQASELAQEYRALRGLLMLFPVFAMAKQSPEITSADGMRLDAEKRDVLHACPQFSRSAAMVDETAISIRLRQIDEVVDGKRRLNIVAELLVSDKQWEPLFRVSQVASTAR